MVLQPGFTTLFPIVSRTELWHPSGSFNVLNVWRSFQCLCFLVLLGILRFLPKALSSDCNGQRRKTQINTEQPCEKICFDLYLATWKETTVHKNICPNSSVVERHKRVACLYEVTLAEERGVLVLTVTTTYINYLDLGYYWPCVSIYERRFRQH